MNGDTMLVRLFHLLHHRTLAALLGLGLTALLCTAGVSLRSEYQRVEQGRANDRENTRRAFELMEYTVISRYRRMAAALNGLCNESSFRIWLKRRGDEEHRLLVSDWKAFLHATETFSQLRFIDMNAVEGPRVTYDAAAERCEEKPFGPVHDIKVWRGMNSLLQSSPRNSVNVSMIHPDPELSGNGSARLSAPVFGNDGSRLGLLTATFPIQSLSVAVQRAARVSPCSLSVANADGRWLYSRDEPEKVWFRSPDKPALKESLEPEMWHQVRSQRYGSWYDEKGLHYHFKVLLPQPLDDADKDLCLILVGTFAPSWINYERQGTLACALLHFAREHGPRFLLGLAVVLTVSVLGAFAAAQRTTVRETEARSSLYYGVLTKLAILFREGGANGLPYTEEHVRRIRQLTELFLSHLRPGGMTAQQAREIVLFVPLLDIGKIGLSPELLRKPMAERSSEEEKTFRAHTALGARLISGTIPAGLDPTIPVNIALYHHEAWDGSGYPRGLAGNAIPLEARLAWIVSSYDMLRSWNFGTPPVSHEEARRKILAASGRVIDPGLAEIFIDAEEEIRLLYDEGQMTPIPIE